MTEQTNPDAVRGGAPCAKEILCNPPAQARARNKWRTAANKSQCERDLKLAKLEGLRALTAQIQSGAIILTGKQAECYHRLAAVLDADEKTFDEAYSALRESLIVTG